MRRTMLYLPGNNPNMLVRGHLFGPDGLVLPMTLALPGAVNRGNATQAVAAAVTLGAEPVAAVAAVSGVDEVAGRYRTVQVGSHTARILLAKNPPPFDDLGNWKCNACRSFYHGKLA